ncbi:acyltransferase family protein [Bifidobacterium leontopitheci]|uniref:Acyltransferase n=1 Tax=Bifidobacterium leontopitheci TaxID=2650774 RepID=A0A6I1GHT1_9BIFI|nr:acyltransferase family protein [Bifidobacterium leontopitheci]KAB7791224.1 acyltransferase [Bifidobacterium leontopitheci]
MQKAPRYKGLDGIKGFALIAIIWYHLASDSLPGGFVGVDVFFTVSGFLLALSVIREYGRSGRFRLGSFYVRRLARLWPAMAFMVAGSVSLSVFVDHDILVGVPGKSVAALTFTSNWMEIFSGGSYFEAASPQLLRHLWFVALLAQATVILPFIVALLVKLRNIVVQVASSAALAVVSGAAMWLLYNPAADPTRVYFGTDTHCFGLLAGVALAFVVYHRETSGRPVSHLESSAASWAATAALVGIIMLMPHVGQDATAFRGGLQLACVLTVVLIYGSIVEGSWMDSLFGWHPLSLLGKYSYGMYLWHWPLFLIIQLMLPAWRGSGIWLIQLLTLVFSALLTALSWWMVERPVAAWIGARRKGAATAAPSRRPSRRGGAHSAPRRGPRVAGSAGAAAVLARQGQPYAAADSIPPSVPAVVGLPTPPPAPRLNEPHLSPAAVKTMNRIRLAVTVPVVILVVVGFVMGVAQAPAKTQVQIMLEKNQGELTQQATKRKLDAKAAAEAKKRAEEEKKRREEARAKAEKMTGENVTVIGDSVTVGASPALQKALPGVVVDAQVSRSVVVATGIIEQMKAQGTLRKYVVISLNTNSEASVADYERIAEAAGTGHVLVLVNAYGDRAWIPRSNQAAADYVRSHPADSTLVDWNSAIAQHVEWLSADKIHPVMGGPGDDLYASLVRQALVNWEIDHIQ